MHISLDVTDLLQLQEIWSRRPIITAFTRLEPRISTIASVYDFRIEDLLPRLQRLKRSVTWLSQMQPSSADPARISLHDLSDDFMLELFPEATSALAQRQLLFMSAYYRFVVAQYRGEVFRTTSALELLLRVRRIGGLEGLNADFLPEEGSPEWIPQVITDEIRSLDDRYKPAEPGTPAAYVVSGKFWEILAKVTAEDIETTVRLGCAESHPDCGDGLRQTLNALVQVAVAWSRSPSVVGLCYQFTG